MASVIYTSFLDDMAGSLDLGEVDVYAMLVGAGYTPDKNHTRRANVTDEVNGTGYMVGGTEVAVTVTKDAVNNRLDIVLGAANWPASTIAARTVVYYVRRGGAADDDELIAAVDGGTVVNSVDSTFTAAASTVRIQN